MSGAGPVALPFRPPPGFEVRREDGALLVVAPGLMEAALAAGLARPWTLVRPRPPGAGTGRGPIGTVTLDRGVAASQRLLVKQYLRGGALRHVNGDRYFSLARFANELAVGARARELGLPVGETVGVVLVPGRPGWRVWGAARYIPHTRDLARIVVSGVRSARGMPPNNVFDAREQDRVLAPELVEGAWNTVLRFLDAGLEHADMNLGNILVEFPPGQSADAASVRYHLIDLDRARFWPGPVPEEARLAVRDRFERSLRKLAPPSPR